MAGTVTEEDQLRQPRPEEAIAQPRHDVRLRYMPGLDGLPARAVVAVLLYHAALPCRVAF